jgi:chemotaxis protein methyltransferase CheR
MSGCLPALASKSLSDDGCVRCCSLGSASGEEPYSLSMFGKFLMVPRFPSVRFEVTACEADPLLVERAKAGCYQAASLKEVPLPWSETAFEREGALFRIRDEYREGVSFVCCDIRNELPPGPFHLILCRNLAFTYFNEELQAMMAEKIYSILMDQGVLMLGSHENLPAGVPGFERMSAQMPFYRKY